MRDRLHNDFVNALPEPSTSYSPVTVICSGTSMSEPEKSVLSQGGRTMSSNKWCRLGQVLDALRLLVEQLSASNKTPEVDPRQHFYQMFNREADEYDKDFHHKYHDDLNTTLIFVGRSLSKPCIDADISPGRTLLCCGFRLHCRYPK